MPSLNKTILIGHLGKDPESRFLPDGKAVCNFTLATSEQWRDKDSGEKREATEWHNIAAFGKLAEICGEYLKKGALVYIEGKLTTRKWEKDGVTRWTTSINADTMKMLGGRGEHSDSKPAEKKSSPAAGGTKSSFDDMDSDIPFSPIGRGIGGHAI